MTLGWLIWWLRLSSFPMITATHAKIVCYYVFGRPDVADVPVDVCTHIALIGSTLVDKAARFLPPSDAEATAFASLKRRRPQLKLLLCLTGANPNFSLLVSSMKKMQRFADDSVKYLNDFELDGIDVDWEFPTWSSDAQKTDKHRFGILLKVLKSKFKDKKILSAAVAGPPTIARIAYDFDALNLYTDFVSVMNYDFHVFRPSVPFVGFNAPLHPMPFEIYPLRLMNSEEAMKAYASSGLAPNKTLFGLPTYARGYRLLSRLLHKPYSPAICSDASFSDYASVCKLEANTIYTKVWNRRAASPYLYGPDKLWLSYENLTSLTAKVGFAADVAGGVMVYDIGSDDVDGDCGFGRYPLLHAIKDATSSHVFQ